MDHRYTLSVCLPIFNQSDLFRDFIDSLPDTQSTKDRVQLVIVNDGSTDDLEARVEELKMANWHVSYYYQENTGRASAMYRTVHKATADWLMIMDGDDYFLPGGLEKILSRIIAFENLKFCASPRPVSGVVFGTEILKSGGSELIHLPENERVSLLGLRADLGIIGDLKEVVRTKVVQDCMQDIYLEYRRVPTSLLWARISDKYDIVTSSEIVAIKRYIGTGMTANISRLKMENVPPLIETFRTRMQSRSYNSWKYRFKAQLSYYQYCYLSGGLGKSKDLAISGIPGFVLGTLLGAWRFRSPSRKRL